MIRNKLLYHLADIDFKLKDKRILKKCLVDFALSEGKETGEINYIFCSDDYLLDINKKYLKHDYYTDIISFQSDNDPLSGDIFISIDRVRDNAKNLKIDFRDELFRVISHGLLHFIGYKDKTKEDKQLMTSKENELINLILNATK
ncbi:MAG: rRNA maturation RNase YbeY [Saprospiraceae bacterium]|nr:rRNA maturation RNase YbeY [Saprospiraceae bacterium]